MRLLWLPAVLRAAGLTVHEVPGWKTRGEDSFGPVRGITCHATAGSRTSTDDGEIRVLLNGSATAPPPIAQLYLSRSGAWWVVASGTCYHNKVGWAGPNEGYGNDSLLGIEAQHSNTAAEPWTTQQHQSYVTGVAALVRQLGIPVARVAGHKEHQPGAKTDPTFDMTRFRAAVATELEDDMSAAAERQIAELHAALVGTRHEWAGGRNTARLITDLGYALLYGQPGTEGTWIARQLLALGEVAGLDPAELEQIRGQLGAELAAADIPGAVVAELGAVESDAEVADRLRALLGERAAAVGALLAQV